MAVNMNENRHEMPTQEPKIRAKNFDEVALGYDEQTALKEAARCLNCKNMPCVSACPVNIRIPAFIEQVKMGEFEIFCAESFKKTKTKAKKYFKIY